MASKTKLNRNLQNLAQFEQKIAFLKQNYDTYLILVTNANQQTNHYQKHRKTTTNKPTKQTYESFLDPILLINPYAFYGFNG